MVIIAYMILMSARNANFTLLQKIVGIFLFAHTASNGVYAVLSRMGLSVAYTTVLKLLRSLSASSKDKMGKIARTRAFLLIYDNINRMQRAWDPDLGTKDRVQNGTAHTMVELDDIPDVKKAFDPAPLHDAQEREARRGLNADVLFNRVKLGHLEDVFALHALSILVTATPSLVSQKEAIRIRWLEKLAVHRMRRGRKTDLHPLETSDFNEGITAENIKILEDLLINQLGMPKDEVEKMMVIVGGDQSTVEKLRTLKKFMASCPHGYSRYGWVLPLIQLWHMGWADLERILNTHWGKGAEDLSGFCGINELLSRKVKDEKRPDYYPALHLVFDTLRADVLACWRSAFFQLISIPRT